MSKKHPGSRFHKALDGRKWQLVRLRCFEAAGWRCQSCGAAGRLEADHVEPLHRGGDAYGLQNLQALCRDCHREKSRREREIPVPGRDEWREYVKELADT